MDDDEKPFACSELGCGMQFTNEDHLAVHMRKHDLSLALNLSGTGMLSPTIGAFTDQTPTPTKFLKNLEEMGLFQELTKNPFDDSFKKAMDETLGENVMAQMGLPLTYANDLDTPQPPIPRIVIGDVDMGAKGPDKAKDTLSSILPKKRKKFLRQQSMPTSTTSEDESEYVIGSSVEIGSTSMETEGGDIEEIIIEVPPPLPDHVSSTQAVMNTTEVISAPSPTVSSSVVVESLPTKTQPPQALVQVLLQLPNGQTVPVQVPAANVVSPKQAALASQQAVQTNSAAAVPKPPQIIQTMTQNIPPFIVTGNQSIVQNVQNVQNVQSMQGAILNQQPQAMIKTSQQSNIPMTVRTVQLAASPLVRNQTNPVQNIVNQDTNNVKTILASDKPGTVKTIMIQQNPGSQNTGLQPGQNVITVSAPQAGAGIQQGQNVFTVTATQAAGIQPNQNVITVPGSGSQAVTGIQQGQHIYTVSGTQAAGIQPSQNVIMSGTQAVAGIQPTQNVITMSGTQAVAGIQQGHVITVSPPTGNVSQNKVQSGSQSYTKQRLKAALQQQGGQKISQILQANEIKQEARNDLDNQSVVSSSGSITSPEDRFQYLMTGSPLGFDSLEDPETRRKKFLERNRAAAARCRQKRKYWISNLENKAEDLATQNGKLCNEVKSLRTEVAQLKTLLIAHKDCPVTMQQRSQGQITAETLTMDTEKEPEVQPTEVIHITDNLSDTDQTGMASLPSVILTDNVERSDTVSNTNNIIQNVLAMNSVSANNTNSVTLPSVLSIDGQQVNGSAANITNVGQYMIPRFVTVNQQEAQKTLSVITGPNSIGLLPKLFNLDQIVQGNANQS